MRFKRVQVLRNRKKMLILGLLLAAAVLAAAFFAIQKKETLVREAAAAVERALGRHTDLEIRVGKISGHLFGFIKLQDVRIEDPSAPEGQRALFHAREVRLRYRLMDFLLKKFDSKVRVSVIGAEGWWRPRKGLRGERFVFLDWMRRWALSQRQHLAIEAKDLSLFFAGSTAPVSGAALWIEDDRFHIDAPFRHVDLAGSDVSTLVHVDGRFQIGLVDEQDSIEGGIRTEGTVVNWAPLEKESSFDFVFSPAGFELHSSDFFGGATVSGSVDFKKDYEVHWKIRAVNYPLSQLGPFVKAVEKTRLPGRADFEIDLEGSPPTPKIDGSARIYDGSLGTTPFKAMDIRVSGVYPTVRLEDSRVLLPDGSVMKFADKTLEFRELFTDKLYHDLVTQAAQDTVVWGPWEFSRPRDVNDQPEFVLQRSLGEKTRLHFRQYNDEKAFEAPDTRPMEVGFEYRLRSKDSLKLEFREEEQFVGVERKTKF